MKHSFVAALLLITVGVAAQQPPALLDSLRKKIAAATTPEARIALLGKASQISMSFNPNLSDSFGREMIEEAELSRDRHLIVRALLLNGERNSYLARKKENLDKAIDFYQQALKVAQENKMDAEIAASYIALSSIYCSVPDAETAMKFCNEASSYVNTADNDSLKAIVYLQYGTVYDLKREKILALRNYLAGLHIAEIRKNSSLLRMADNSLAGFYSDIEDYDRAIDYAVRAMNLLSDIGNGQPSQYQRTVDLYTIGTLYSSKKDYDMANFYFAWSLRLADSLHYEPLRVPAYQGIINNYLQQGNPRKALDFLNGNPALKQSALQIGMGKIIDYGYGFIYTDLGRFDSAEYHYHLAAPFFENSSNEAGSYVYYYQVGRMYKLKGDNASAIRYFLDAARIGRDVNDPKRVLDAAKELDTLYMLTGDYKTSRVYSDMYHQYRDSLDKLGKEKDLLQIEAADEQQRQVRLEKERLDRINRKNTIQYNAIIFGIVALFIMLVVLGMFKVSAGVIKAISFFSFLMLFEFIFLVFKKNIHSITEGEPWKDLAFMIALAALLVPLHHWLEHRVLKYLTSHNRLTSAGSHIRKRLWGKRNSQ